MVCFDTVLAQPRLNGDVPIKFPLFEGELRDKQLY